VALSVLVGCLTSGFGLTSLLAADQAPKAEPPPLFAGDLKFMPDSMQFVYSDRIEQERKSGVYGVLKKEFPELGSWPEMVIQGMGGGLKEDDFTQITVGASIDNAQLMAVVRTRKPLSADNIKSSAKGQKFTESKTASGTLYATTTFAFCVPEMDTSLVVVSNSPDALRKVLDRNGKPELAEGMQAAIKLVDLSSDEALALDLRDLKLKMFEKDRSLPPPLAKGLMEICQDVQAIAWQGRYTDVMDITLVMACKNAKTAEDYRKLVDGLLVVLKKATAIGQENTLMTKNVEELVDAFKVSNSGNNVNVKVTCKPEEVVKLVKEVQKTISGGK